jgi:hypothetical protein
MDAKVFSLAVTRLLLEAFRVPMPAEMDTVRFR